LPGEGADDVVFETGWLANEGHIANQKRIRRLMRLMRLMPIYQKPNISKPVKGHETYPYLLGGLAEGQGLRIEHRVIRELVPYARNARTHSEAQDALIAGSIREYGFTNSVLVDGGNGVIAGHGRVIAARTLGLATVIEPAHLSEAQKKAYILAYNRLAGQAGWDSTLLSLELGELSDLGRDRWWLRRSGLCAERGGRLMGAAADDPHGGPED